MERYENQEQHIGSILSGMGNRKNLDMLISSSCFHKDMGAIRKHREPGRIRRNLGEARVTQGHLGNSGTLGLRKLPQASLRPSGGSP